MSRLFLTIVGCVGTFFLFFFSTLVVLDYLNETPGHGCSPGTSCCPEGRQIVLARPFPRMEGHAYNVPLPQFSNLGDTNTNMGRSPATLCEGNYQLGPGHTPHADIVANGLGRFSHYDGTVVFSSSDNTDPNLNGREYKIVFPPPCSGLRFLVGLC